MVENMSNWHIRPQSFPRGKLITCCFYLIKINPPKTAKEHYFATFPHDISAIQAMVYRSLFKMTDFE
jgi:hypothetical protein